MGIINLVSEDKDLEAITQHRPLATVPFGGRYRLIDFVLSSMVNSGIENIGVLSPHLHRSLVDHLRFGGDWRLACKKDGLVLLPPLSPETDNLGGDVRNFHSNLDFLHKSCQEYVMVAGANVVGSLDYREVLKFHEETAADITFVYKNEDHSLQDCPNCSVADVQSDGRLTGISHSPVKLDNGNFLLGTYLLKKNLLVELVERSMTRGEAGSLVGEITANLDHLKVRAYHYPGYIARIHCLPSYYRHSMNLLSTEAWRQLFVKTGQIYTKVREEAPTRYTEAARVANVLVAGGCIVAGTVKDSVLFQRVTVGKGAQVRGSILMPNTEVAENAVLENVICDKDVKISAGTRLCGLVNNPLVIRKGTVI